MKPGTIFFNPSFYFHLVVFSVILLLVGSSLVQDGMFMDGELYASVAHNLANGFGTFWHPHFSENTMPFFHEQPPLTFGIQAVFFKLFGNSIYVERFYSFLTVCISSWLIHCIWQQLFSNDEAKKISWLPVLLWITIPVCFWAYSNNMEENTMGVFVLSSVLVQLVYFNRSASSLWLLVVAALLLVLASLCKGFPGLFPVVFPLLFRFFSNERKIKQGVLEVLFLLTVVGVSYCILLLMPEIRHSIFAYLNDRVLNSIKNVASVDSRFDILGQLFMELLPAIILTGTLFFIQRGKGLAGNKNRAILFLILGLCGSLPLIITKEQRGFYLVTSLPYYAVGLSVFIAPIVLAFAKNINSVTCSFNILKIAAIVLFLVSLSVTIINFGKTRRDADKLHDIYLFGNIIPSGSTVNIDSRMWNDWSLQTYMMRKFFVTLDGTDSKKDCFILDKSLNQAADTIYYEKVNVDSKIYDLYKRKR